MHQFHNFITLLKEKTKWKAPKEIAENHISFTIYGKDNDVLEVELFTPDNVHLIAKTSLGKMPLDDFERSDFLKEHAKKQMGVCKKRPSIVTIDKDSVIIYKKEKMNDIHSLLASFSSFLKDVDWWLQKESHFSSPFSHSFSWNK